MAKLVAMTAALGGAGDDPKRVGYWSPGHLPLAGTASFGEYGGEINESMIEKETHPVIAYEKKLVVAASTCDKPGDVY